MWLDTPNLEILLHSLLPDLLLSFALFTSLAYKTLAARFHHKRVVVVLSTTIGLALSLGLVSWESQHGFSIKDLGIVAVTLLVLILAIVIFQVIRKTSGLFTGASVTIGISLITAYTTDLWRGIDPRLIQSAFVILLFCVLIAIVTRKKASSWSPNASSGSNNNKPLVPDMARLFRERHLSDSIEQQFRKIHKDANQLTERPDAAGSVIAQLNKMLPAQGYLTQKMANLRAKAHQIRKGHVARLEETRDAYKRLPIAAKRKAAAELSSRYKQLIGIDKRLERLDQAVAENEKRIRELTRKAQVYTSRYDYPNLTTCLKAAEKLQHHNTKLFKTIDHTEKRLTDIAKKVAAQASNRPSQ